MKLFASLCVVFTLGASSIAVEPTRRPNILFFFSDDQRADTIAALGNPHIQTPNLDRLVADGTSFTRAYCMGAMQGAVCVPSRAMLMTGRTLFRVKEQFKEQTTWPEKFSQAGYATFISGKWHNGGESVTRVFAEGKAVFLGGMTEPYTAPVQDIADDKLTAKRPSGKHSVELFADSAIEFLGRQKADRPFLCYVAFNAPHDPRTAPKEYHDRYNTAKPPLPLNFLPLHPFNNGNMTGRDEELAPWPRTEPVVRQHLADYYASISFMDSQIGRILTALRETGQVENTIIVFASDSGLAIGSHGLFGKQDLYEDSMRTPLIFAGPKIPKNTRRDSFAYLLDVFPTLGDLAGVSAPDGSEGISLAPVLARKKKVIRDSVFTAYKDVQRAIRDDRWKLIVYPQINKTQLFDLQRDPHETKDIAVDEPRQVKRLTARLQQSQREAGDHQPLTVERPRPQEFDFTNLKQTSSTRNPSPTRRPNIILVMTDDQGYGELSCHGNPILKTPNLDRLWSESVRFTDFHVSPTCAPTRAALLTGRHEFRSGVTHTIFERERLSLKATTLAQTLKNANYATGIFGKWHLGDEAAYQPDRRGFDEVFIHGAGGIGQTYPGSCGDAPGNTYFDPAILHNGKFEKTRGFCTDVFFEQATQWIEKRRTQPQPFFAYITPNAPHAPYVCPDAYLKPYEGLGLNKDAMAYYGMISNIDDNIGRLLSKLKEWEIERETLVIFMTDNGHSIANLYNAGMRSAKGTPYQGGTRVPLFVRWTGTLPAGVDVNALAAHVDIVPTLTELAGAKNPEGMKLDGRSLAPLLKNAGAPWPDRALITHVGRWEKGKASDSKYSKCAVRNSRFRLINNTELYDIQADPAEKRNVIADHPDVVAAMRAAYDQWWQEILPALENEDAVGPAVNPFKELYWKQFGKLEPKIPR